MVLQELCILLMVYVPRKLHLLNLVILLYPLLYSALYIVVSMCCVVLS